MLGHNKNQLKIHISRSGGPYFKLVICYDVVYKFLDVLKKYQISPQNPKGLAFGFIENTCSQ
jgi:hypothetical protein